MQIQLLGGVGASDNGAAIDIGPAKCQALLAALAMTPRTAVSVSRLVAMVWGEDPPRTAEKTLQTYVARLRRELGEQTITRVGTAYRLELDGDAVDAVRFQQLAETGAAEAALAEWTGQPFEGLDADGLAPAAQRLVELWLAATETHLGHLVDSSDPAAAIGPLSELLALHPFREHVCELLMTALYRVGRQADALAAFRATRRELIEQLGVEPGPALRDLERRILSHDGALTPGSVTVGFVDIDGATRAWVHHPHESAAALARHEQLVRSLAAEHGGEVFAHTGDSFGATFDLADDAAGWARALQTAVQREPWPRGVEIRVRIGLHSAPAQHAGSDQGAVVNVASCLAAAGHGGQTLLSSATADLLSDRPSVRDLGTYVLDGVPGEQRVLQLGDGSHPALRSADDRRRGNLPRRAGRLIGRDGELRRVSEALAHSPMVTLVGPGGIGKTSLATAAALAAEADFDGDAWLIELASVGHSSDVARAVADALGARETASRDHTNAAVAALRDRHALLVLDNCEHVVEGAAAFAHTLIAGCPHVSVLATSRERLGVAGETLVEVGPLDATLFGTELFRERATALDPSFDSHGSRAEIEEICRRLDGVPLAIELAAARTRTMRPADLLARLHDSLRVLTSGGRTGVEHHRTLRATVEWSHDLLSPAERTIFRRLSAFVGPFDVEAAEAVTPLGGTDGDAIDPLMVDDLVARLVDQSIVLAEPGPFGRRLRLLETIRQFAAEQLSAQGEGDAIGAQHAQWCVAQVRRIHDLLAGHDEVEGVARLDELLPNLRAAIDWAVDRGDGQLARTLVEPIAAEALIRSKTEIADWAQRILAIASPDDEALIVFSLSLAARRYWRLQDRHGYERLVERYGEPDHPMVHHARALVEQDAAALIEWCPRVAAALRAAGDDHLAQLSDVGSPRSMMVLGRFAEADELLQALASRYRANGPPSLLSWMLTMLGYSAAAQGHSARAEQLFAESAAIEVPPGTHARNRPVEALAAMRRGDRARALLILRSDVDDLIENDDVFDMSGTAIAFISIMATLGRFRAGLRAEGYLTRTGIINTPIMQTIADDAVARLAAAPTDVAGEERAIGARLDGRQVLCFMLDELSALVKDAGHD